MADSTGNVLDLGSTPRETILKLSWPTILEQIAFTVLQFSDTAMVGVLGAVCTAAVGITTPVVWLIGGLISAVGVGFSVQVAQNIGAGLYHRARAVVTQGLLVSLLLGVVMSAACFFLSPFLPTLMGAQPDVEPYARSYITIISLSVFFNCVEVYISSVLRCMGNTRAPMVANLASIVLNIGVNFLLIFPERTILLGGRSFHVWGAGMGVAGAAWGTVVSIAVAALLLLFILLSGRGELRLDFSRFFSTDQEVFARAWVIGLPVALERATISLGQVVFMRIVATMGTVAVAAHHLAVSAESLSYLPAFGFSVAATTLVGQSVGARQRDRAMAFGHISGNIGLFCMTCTGVVLFVFFTYLISLSSQDPLVIALGSRVLKIVAFAQPMQAWAIVYAGALRGAGDSRWPFYISLLGVWGIRVLLGLLFAFGFGFGLESIWIAMLIDLCVRGVITRRRFSTGHWYLPD